MEKITARLQSKKNYTIIMVGDSITRGCFHLLRCGVGGDTVKRLIARSENFLGKIRDAGV